MASCIWSCQHFQVCGRVNTTSKPSFPHSYCVLSCRTFCSSKNNFPEMFHDSKVNLRRALLTLKLCRSIGIGGLNYISLGIGFFLGTQICAPLNDRIYRRLTKKNDNVAQPEYRIPLMIPGSILVPSGLFIYGWTSQYHTHWIGPNIGAALFAAGVIIGFQCIQTYLVDSYTRFAASAIAAATVLRSAAGFGFPLFAPYMYNALHYGWGNSLLGFIAIGLGVPAPILLWHFGKRLRERSPFAAGGD